MRSAQTKTALPLGRAVINNFVLQEIRLSATNGSLVFSAVKIVVAKKAGICVHIGRDCNGGPGMCQAIGGNLNKIW